MVGALPEILQEPQTQTGAPALTACSKAVTCSLSEVPSNADTARIQSLLPSSDNRGQSSNCISNVWLVGTGLVFISVFQTVVPVWF